MLRANRGGEDAAVNRRPSHADEAVTLISTGNVAGPKMAQARTHRIESEIQRVLAGLLAREVKDPRVGNVTITAVSAAGDMGSVRVFFTPFASQHPPDEVCRALNHAAGFLRGELGRRLALRYAPRLEFVHDESVEGAAHLTHLIDRAVAGDRAGSGDRTTDDREGGADRDRADPRRRRRRRR